MKIAFVLLFWGLATFANTAPSVDETMELVYQAQEAKKQLSQEQSVELTSYLKSRTKALKEVFMGALVWVKPKSKEDLFAMNPEQLESLLKADEGLRIVLYDYANEILNEIN